MLRDQALKLTDRVEPALLIRDTAESQYHPTDVLVVHITQGVSLVRRARRSSVIEDLLLLPIRQCVRRFSQSGQRSRTVAVARTRVTPSQRPKMGDQASAGLCPH